MKHCLFVICFATIFLFAACGSRAGLAPAPQIAQNPENLPEIWKWPFEPQEEPVGQEARSALSLSCSGYNRWAIKTMADPQKARVNLTPASTTIAALRAMPKPSPFPVPSEFPTRIAPYELTTYRLTGVTLYEIYPPGGDQDYHIVLQDNAANQFITESVNYQCAPGSSVLTQMQAVRGWLDARYHFPNPPAPIYPNVKVNVTGVGFFDPWTGDEHPASGAELHPVLSIAFPTPTPSPSPSPSGQTVSGTVTSIIDATHFTYQTGYPHGFVQVIYSESMVKPASATVKVNDNVTVVGTFVAGKLQATSVTINGP